MTLAQGRPEHRRRVVPYRHRSQEASLLYDNAVEAGAACAVHQAEVTLRPLLACLGVDRASPNWRAEIAPFAPVWAAMITAAATNAGTVAATGRD